MHEANRRSIYSAPEISGRSFCGNRDHCLLGSWVHAHSLGPPPIETERTVDSNCPGTQREGTPSDQEVVASQMTSPLMADKLLQEDTQCQ